MTHAEVYKDYLARWPAPWCVEFEERAAHYEYDCRLARDTAERKALNELRVRFSDIPPGLWKWSRFPRLVGDNFAEMFFVIDDIILSSTGWQCLTFKELMMAMPRRQYGNLKR
jgi:hypothetical protein